MISSALVTGNSLPNVEFNAPIFVSLVAASEIYPSYFSLVAERGERERERKRAKERAEKRK